MIGELALGRLGDRLAEAKGGARGGVALVLVVDLEDLRVPALAEGAGGEPGEAAEEGDADAEVGVADDRDGLRRRGEGLAGLAVDPGRPENQRHAGLDAALDVSDRRPGEGEVDDDGPARAEVVGDGDADVDGAGDLTGVHAPTGTARAIDRAGEHQLFALGDLADQGAAHPAAGADDDHGGEVFAHRSSPR